VTQQVAFLRAVNVGQRTCPMATLKAIVEGLGYDDVFTYINSGNVAFSTTTKAATVEKAIEAALLDRFGFEVETFVRTQAQLAAVLAARPFDEPAGHTHMVTFFRSKATAAQVKELEALSNDTDLIVVDGRELHWRIKGGVSDSTITPAMWRKVPVGPCTSRKTTALEKLLAKLG